MLDRESLLEIMDAFIGETVAVPSDRRVRALAESAGLPTGGVRELFEERNRAAGHETQLFDAMPFSGSG